MVLPWYTCFEAISNGLKVTNCHLWKFLAYWLKFGFTWLSLANFCIRNKFQTVWIFYYKEELKQWKFPSAMNLQGQCSSMQAYASMNICTTIKQFWWEESKLPRSSNITETGLWTGYHNAVNNNRMLLYRRCKIHLTLRKRMWLWDKCHSPMKIIFKRQKQCIYQLPFICQMVVQYKGINFNVHIKL